MKASMYTSAYADAQGQNVPITGRTEHQIVVKQSAPNFSEYEQPTHREIDEYSNLAYKVPQGDVSKTSEFTALIIRNSTEPEKGVIKSVRE